MAGLYNWTCYACHISGPGFYDQDGSWDDLKAHEGTTEHIKTEHSDLIKMAKWSVKNLREFEEEQGLEKVEI